MEHKRYTNEDAGFSGVVPEGWIEQETGQFVRGASETDPTFLVLAGLRASLSMISSKCCCRSSSLRRSQNAPIVSRQQTCRGICTSLSTTIIRWRAR